MSKHRYGICGLGLALFVGLILFVPLASAEIMEPEVVEEAANSGGLSWKLVMESGGFPMYVLMYGLGALSILTLTFVIYFFAVLRTPQIAPLPLHRELVEKIKAGAIDDARRACNYRPCPLSSVALAALEYLRTVSTPDPVLLRDVIQGEGGRQAEAIEGQTQYLQDIAVISPMIGLLGTVYGMMQAFSAVALDIANAKPVALAGGVSQALVTTAFGLIVGIPAMMFYSYFRRRASKLVSYLESASTDILTALLGEKSYSSS